MSANPNMNIHTNTQLGIDAEIVPAVPETGTVAPSGETAANVEADALEHLAQAAREMLDKPLAAKIRSLFTDRTIMHPTLVGVLNEIEWLIREPPRQRARGLLICGVYGSGKTAIAEHVQRTYPVDQPKGKPRVVGISISSARKTKDVLNRLAAAAQAPLSRLRTTADHELMVIETLRAMNCKLLILDETNDLSKVAEREQLRVIQTVKYIMNTLRLPVLAFSTVDELNPFRSDPHLAARFDVIEMPTWEVGEDFGQFLDAFESYLPLRRRSNLRDEKTQKLLIKRTNGVLMYIVERIRVAAANAMNEGRERITRKDLGGAIARPSAELLLRPK